MNAAISREAQRARLLKALRRGPVTTLLARKELDILHPAGRVRELREEGHEIVTHWRTVETADGTPHRIAEYVLLIAAANDS